MCCSDVGKAGFANTALISGSEQKRQGPDLVCLSEVEDHALPVVKLTTAFRKTTSVFFLAGLNHFYHYLAPPQAGGWDGYTELHGPQHRNIHSLELKGELLICKYQQVSAANLFHQ